MSSIGKLTPAVSAVAVTKSDDTIIPYCRMVLVGGDGDLVVDMRETGADITFPAVAGIPLPIDVKKIKAATTATDIVVFY
jgi:hypothetical protein